MERRGAAEGVWRRGGKRGINRERTREMRRYWREFRSQTSKGLGIAVLYEYPKKQRAQPYSFCSFSFSSFFFFLICRFRECESEITK
jgi:hypothetical protein